MDNDLKKYLDKKFGGVDRKVKEVNRKFSEVDRLKEYLEKKFDDQEKKFKGINQRFDDQEKKFEGINRRFDHHDLKFIELEQQLEKVWKEISKIHSEMSTLTKIQTTMEHRHGELLNAIFDKLDQFEKHVQDKTIHVNPHSV